MSRDDWGWVIFGVLAGLWVFKPWFWDVTVWESMGIFAGVFAGVTLMVAAGGWLFEKFANYLR